MTKELIELEEKIRNENFISKEEDEIEEPIVIQSSSNIIMKIIKVFGFKMIDLFKKEKALALLVVIILTLSIKKQFNFAKIFQFVSLMK